MLTALARHFPCFNASISCGVVACTLVRREVRYARVRKLNSKCQKSARERARRAREAKCKMVCLSSVVFVTSLTRRPGNDEQLFSRNKDEKIQQMLPAAIIKKLRSCYINIAIKALPTS